MKESDYLGLLSDLVSEFRHFEANRDRVQQAQLRVGQEPSDLLLWYSYAYLVHNLYNGLEAYFHRISQFYENGLPKETWHKVLLDRMTTQIEGYRPAVMLLSDLTPFQELRAFRHLVRHLYDRDLDPARIRFIEPHLNAVVERFPAIHERFSESVKRMASA
jgi:hypothetical protein